MVGNYSLPGCFTGRSKQFGFVDLKRPTLLKLQSCFGRSTFTENYQTIDKRILTLYPIGWSKDSSVGEQLDMFGAQSEQAPMVYEHIFSLQDQRIVAFINEGLNRIMSPARFLVSATNTPLAVPIMMEEVALAGRLVPKLDLDFTRPNAKKKKR